MKAKQQSTIRKPEKI